LNKYKLIIFVDGDFWHGYGWVQRKNNIKSNTGFWIPKIERNMQRDRQVNAFWAKQGFSVFRFWEHQINKELGSCLKLVLDHINLKSNSEAYTVD
jgi:DNA mismatch endonuclease, patch repair protein